MSKRILPSLARAAVGFGKWYISPKTKPGFYVRLALAAAVLASPVANFFTVRVTEPTALVRVPSDPPIGTTEKQLSNPGDPLEANEIRYLQDLESTQSGIAMTDSWVLISNLKENPIPFNDAVRRSIRVGCNPVGFPSGGATTAIDLYRAAVESSKTSCIGYPVHSTD